MLLFLSNVTFFSNKIDVFQIILISQISNFTMNTNILSQVIPLYYKEYHPQLATNTTLNNIEYHPQIARNTTFLQGMPPLNDKEYHFITGNTTL